MNWGLVEAENFSLEERDMYKCRKAFYPATGTGMILFTVL